MKIAVFGANGFIGRNLVNHLKSCGHELVIYTSADGQSVQSQTGLLVENFKLPTNVDCVFYLCQSPFYRKANESIRHLTNVNVVTPFEVAQIARDTGVSKFFYASSGNVYAPSFECLKEESPLRRSDLYSLSKVHGEALLNTLESEMKICSLRFFGIFGPGQTQMIIGNLTNRIRSNQSIQIERNPTDPTDLDGLRISFMGVDDTVKVLERLATTDAFAKAINIAGPAAISIRQVATGIAELIGNEPKFELVNRERQLDLDADISLLTKLINPVFSDFQTALKRSLSC